MFPLHSVLLMALDVVRGPYLHCFAPVNPFEREDAGGFSDIFVPRPEFCRCVMSLLEAESGLFFLFYPEEIAGLHYTRKTLRYTLCFVFRVDPSLVTIGAADARRHVEPYSIVLMSIAEELRDAELRSGFMSRGLSSPGDTITTTTGTITGTTSITTATTAGTTAMAMSPMRVNTFLTPVESASALALSSLDSLVASLFACLGAADHRSGIVPVRLSASLAFRIRRMPSPRPSSPNSAPTASRPLHAMDDVPVPIAECAADAMEWADLVVHDVFKASDGHRTVGDIVRLLSASNTATKRPDAAKQQQQQQQQQRQRRRPHSPLGSPAGAEPSATITITGTGTGTGTGTTGGAMALSSLSGAVLEALRHLEAQHYVRVVRPCRLRSAYCATRALGRVLCDPSHAARRVLGQHLLSVAAQCPCGAINLSRGFKGSVDCGRSLEALPAVVPTPAALERQNASPTLSIEAMSRDSPIEAMSRDSSIEPMSRDSSLEVSREFSNGATRTQGDGRTTYSEEEIDAAAAAALCALGKFTNNTIPNVRREMRRIPAWRNAFAKWDEACCKALVEVAVLNGWLVEVPSAVHTGGA